MNKARIILKSLAVKFLFGLSLAGLFSSCATIYYPSHINSSFIQSKGETNLGGALSMTSLNAQVSTAPTEHLRLAGEVNYWGWSVSLGNSSVGEAGIHSQFLAGYYTKLGRKVFFEGYGGIGVSSVSGSDFFGHAILQPSFGFGQDQPKFIISLRTSYLNNSIFDDPDNGVNLGPDETSRISGMYYDLGLTHNFHRTNKTWFIQYGLSGGDIQLEHGDNTLIPFMNFGVNFKLFSKKISQE
jgi:hypothetical protein